MYIFYLKLVLSSKYLIVLLLGTTIFYRIVFSYWAHATTDYSINLFFYLGTNCGPKDKYIFHVSPQTQHLKTWYLPNSNSNSKMQK